MDFYIVKNVIADPNSLLTIKKEMQTENELSL